MRATAYNEGDIVLFTDIYGTMYVGLVVGRPYDDDGYSKENVLVRFWFVPPSRPEKGIWTKEEAKSTDRLEKIGNVTELGVQLDDLLLW